MSITHSLPLSEWYRDTTSPWTLDYPPLFAWFEYLLSQVAAAFHPQMLVLRAAPYQSWHTTLLQRTSVIACDVIMISCAWFFSSCLSTISCSSSSTSLQRTQSNSPSPLHDSRTMFIILLSLHAGPIIVDNIHFQ
jgi:alpha-1,3-glucosyltransferase